MKREIWWRITGTHAGIIAVSGLLFAFATYKLWQTQPKKTVADSGGEIHIRSAPFRQPDKSRIVKTKATSRPVFEQKSAPPLPSYLAQALKRIDSLTDPGQQTEQLEYEVAAVPEQIFAEALNALALPRQTASAVIMRQLLLRRWTALDPVSASSWAEVLADPQTKQEAFSHVAIVWSETDPNKAGGWALALPQGEARESAVLAVGFERIRENPMESLQLASKLIDSQRRTQLVEQAVGEWGNRNPLEAQEWVLQMEDESLRQVSLARLATVWSGKEPELSAKLAATFLTPGQEQDRAVVSVMQRWAKQDPDSAAEWLSQFPDGRLQADALDNLIGIWTSQEFEAPAQWLYRLPVGELRDRGLASFAQKIAPFDHQSAINYSELITDEQTRKRSLQAVRILTQ